MSRIAIIAACGKSQRTGLSDYTTKAAFRLLPNITILGHTLAFLRKNGVSRTFVVGRPEHARVLGACLPHEERATVSLLLAEPGCGWAGTVERATNFISPEDEIVLVSCDNVHTAEEIEALGPKKDALFSYTRWTRTDRPPSNGPVFGRKEGETSFSVQSGPGFVGDFFSGYVVVRGKTLLAALEALSPSPRGEKEIADLLALLSTSPSPRTCQPVPYPGTYEDVSDLPSLGRIAARLRQEDGTEETPCDLGAGIVVYDTQGRILLGERQDGLGFVPPGGFVDEGETFAQAAIRELAEEVGLEIEERDLRLLGVYPTRGKSGNPAVSVIFHAEVLSDLPLHLDAHETRTAKWFHREEIENLNIPFDLDQAVHDAFDGHEIDTRKNQKEPAVEPRARNGHAEKFSLRDGLVLFSSDRPGAHATMFGPDGKKLGFRGDASSFSDEKKSYTWAFSLNQKLTPGDQVVFATSDREVAAEGTRGGRLRKKESVSVLRDGRGEPDRIDIPKIDSPPPKEKEEALVIAPFVEPALPDDGPLVSILTCTYNRPEMLAEAIASVRSQTVADWEHLIFDNGSTDPKVKNVLDQAQKNDPRIRIFHAERNIDQPAIRWNELLDHARGKTLAFLDDDNTKYQNFLEVLSTALRERPEVDMVTSGFVMHEMSGQVVLCQINLQTDQLLETRNTVDTGTFLIRREAFEKIGYFPLTIRTNEDWAMMRRAKRCLRIEHRAEILATWREHKDQRMRRTESLGNRQDKTWIESEAWYGEIGVTLHRPPIRSLSENDLRKVAEVEHAIETIPWVKEGKDLDLVLFPARREVADVETLAASAKRIALLGLDDSSHMEKNLARARAAASKCRDAWAVTNDPEMLPTYAAALEGRAVALGYARGKKQGDFPAWALTPRTRIARMLNAIRSPRFEARIP